MSIDERDFRMVVVAFEDAVTWCTTVADLADSLVAAVAAKRVLSAPDLQAARTQVAETRRYLEANLGEVRRIKARVGLA